MNDEYLLSKFEKLQAAAREALADIDAIPGDASVFDESDAIAWAIAPVERAAERFCMIEPTTTVGAAMMVRVAAWLDGDDGLDDLARPVAVSEPALRAVA